MIRIILLLGVLGAGNLASLVGFLNETQVPSSGGFFQAGTVESGSIYDPNGGQTHGGGIFDPNGGAADGGSIYDPDGGY
jgi:hypothetical protein